MKIFDERLLTSGVRKLYTSMDRIVTTATRNMASWTHDDIKSPLWLKAPVSAAAASAARAASVAKSAARLEMMTPEQRAQAAFEKVRQ
jgi:hypothetical protein